MGDTGPYRRLYRRYGRQNQQLTGGGVSGCIDFGKKAKNRYTFKPSLFNKLIVVWGCIGGYIHIKMYTPTPHTDTV